MILVRLLLVYGLPAGIVAVGLYILKQAVEWSDGGRLSANAGYLLLALIMAAIIVCFFFHFRTRNWADW
jgi:hypothetical protein